MACIHQHSSLLPSTATGAATGAGHHFDGSAFFLSLFNVNLIASTAAFVLK
jgi:hypothetical protein